jgi:hypothetical protein
MVGRLNRQYDNRMRRVVNQQKAQVEAVEASAIVAITAMQDEVDNLTTDVTAIDNSVSQLEVDVAALTVGTATTDTFVDTSASATAFFTYYAKTTGGLGTGEALPAMTDVLPGKQIMYTLVTDGGGNFTLSGTMKYQAATYTAAVFNDAGDMMLLIAVDNSGTLEWHILSYSGVSLS